MKHFLKYILVCAILSCQYARAAAQDKMDTAAMVKAFGRVMDFASQPYVYYSTSSKMISVPVLNPEDTLSTKGLFYKSGTDMYYSNGPEEIYLQDSLLVQVNNERKSIWVSRVDMAGKEKLQHASVGNRQLQELMRKRYSLQHKKLTEQSSGFQLEAKQLKGQSTYVTSTINLSYGTSDYLPRTLQMQIRLQQPAVDELVQQIRDGGLDENSLLKQIDGKRYIVRTQQVNTVFADFDNTERKARQMPLWTSILAYNAPEQSFTGTGAYADYEVVKTF